MRNSEWKKDWIPACAGTTVFSPAPPFATPCLGAFALKTYGSDQMMTPVLGSSRPSSINGQ